MCKNGIRGKSVASLLSSMKLTNAEISKIQKSVHFDLNQDPTGLDDKAINELFCMDRRTRRFGLF
jgi:hypothetical protein